MWIIYDMAALEIVARFRSLDHATRFAARYSRECGPAQLYWEAV